MTFLRYLAICIAPMLYGVTGFAASDAEWWLQLRNSEFQPEVIEVAPSVYTAVGFGVSPTSMLVGESGLVIIDTQIDQSAAQSVFKEFRKITDKPVQGIVSTHGHGGIDNSAGN